eukprot:TRINITY_DN16122_c0_g2_i1.p1 TRINITY_DN16122_c0_g2~~TRINITY_DN16122_c0_g2_i1.p1  ORF type:complete len:668 (-),score=125.04 TRINITY_DN16122_c0_g2_i1:39-2042(-)
MAQMRLLETQKKKAEIEIDVLEKLQVETKKMIQKTFSVCVANLVKDMKGIVRNELLADLRPMMREELSATMRTFSDNLASTVGENVRDVLVTEVKNVSNGPKVPPLMNLGMPGASAGIAGVRSASPRLPCGRSVLRSNLRDRKNVSKIISKQKIEMQKRRSIISENTPEHDLGVGVGVREPLLSDLPVDPAKDEDLDHVVREAEECCDTKEGTDTWYQDKLDIIEAIVYSGQFEAFMCFIIFLSAVTVGMQADHISKTLDETNAPAILTYLDSFTLIVFACELLARLAVERDRFFTTSDDLEWNIFDSFLVFFQIVDTLISSYASTANMKAISTFRLVRVVRVLRLLRLVRLIRLTRIVLEFRLIATTLASTTRSLLGAIGVFALVIYLVGVFVTEQVALARADMLQSEHPATDDPDTANRFSSLVSTMLTLFMSATDGLLWGSVLEESNSAVFFVRPLFCIYSAFVNFAMLNVITGIFVKYSSEAAAETQDEAIVMQINALFNKQTSHNNELTYAEYEAVVKTPEMNFLFGAINLDPSEFELLFVLLDTNTDGVIDYDDFINGALRLRGPARSVELAMFAKDALEDHRKILAMLKNMNQKLSDFHTNIESTNAAVQEIQHLLGAAQWSHPQLEEVLVKSYTEEEEGAPQMQLVSPTSRTHEAAADG